MTDFAAKRHVYIDLKVNVFRIKLKGLLLTKKLKTINQMKVCSRAIGFAAKFRSH